MKQLLFLAGLLLSASVGAFAPTDYASQWTLQTDKADAYSVTLDNEIYSQIKRSDLSDLAAFNAAGEELAFGPLPSSYRAPASEWHEAAWFALPSQQSSGADAGDLHLHVTRGTDGSLTLDSTLSAAQPAGTSGIADLLIDTGAKDHVIDAITIETPVDALDFGAQIRVEASNDLLTWHEVVADAPLAQLHQNGHTLLVRTVEFDALHAIYLRLHASAALPVHGVELRTRSAGQEQARKGLIADFEGRDGRAYLYRLAGPAPVDRLTVGLADDNAVMHFSVATRELGETEWRDIGGYTAFHLRGVGLALDAQPMRFDATRTREWRIEPDSDLAKRPQLHFEYEPESWVVITHGSPPYSLVAGSRRAQRSSSNIDALVDQVRASYGPQWRPPTLGHDAMRVSGGDSALEGWDETQRRTWLLWGVLALGAAAVIVMVIGLLGSRPKPKRPQRRTAPPQSNLPPKPNMPPRPRPKPQQ